MITGCTIRGYCTPQEPKEEEGDRNNIIQVEGRESPKDDEASVKIGYNG